MKRLQRFRNKKVYGAEMVVTGGALIFFTKIVVFYLAPIAVCIYGLYRWLFRKRYNEGIIILAVGILLLFLLRGPLEFLKWLPYIAGALLLAYGAFLMILPGDPELKQEQLEGKQRQESRKEGPHDF